MSAFVLKLIALISMLFDHSGYIIFGGTSWFNFIGRIAFPIFAFQISEGYIHTKNVNKYFLRLFAFSLVSQIPFMLFVKSISSTTLFNIFFTFLYISKLCGCVADKIQDFVQHSQKFDRRRKRRTPAAQKTHRVSAFFPCCRNKYASLQFVHTTFKFWPIFPGILYLQTENKLFPLWFSPS